MSHAVSYEAVHTYRRSKCIFSCQALHHIHYIILYNMAIRVALQLIGLYYISNLSTVGFPQGELVSDLAFVNLQ